MTKIAAARRTAAPRPRQLLGGVPQQAQRHRGETHRDQRLDTPDRHAANQQVAGLAFAEDKLHAGHAQKRAYRRAERIGEDSRRRLDPAVEQGLQCGKGKQTVVSGGDGSAQHSHNQSEMLHDRSGPRDPHAEGRAQGALGERDKHHRRQRQRDEQILGERRHWPGFPLLAR